MQQRVIDDSEIEDVIMSLQDLSVDQLQDSYRLENDMEDLDEMEDVYAQSTTDNNDIQQLPLSGTFYTYPYKIIGDNFDTKVNLKSIIL